ncbi:MAG: beta-galactosidase domain 4-containing protein [[Clostridium] symbiosum]
MTVISVWMDWSIRTERHTGLKELKNVNRPARVVSFCQETREAVIRNYLDFTNLKEYASVAWEVTCDGACIADGVLEGAAMPDILPHGEAAVRLDFQVPEAGKCFLKLRYIRRESTRLTEAGTELGFDEILLKNEDGRNQTALRMLERCGKACADRNQSSPFTVKEDDRRLFVSGPNFAHVYNKLTGVLEEMNVNQCRLLERPVEYNIWQAPRIMTATSN